MSASDAQAEKKAFEQMLQMTQARSWRPNWICEVKSVDRDAKTCTCQPMSGDAEKTASLRAVENDDTDYVVLYPKVGSLVLVELVERIDTTCVVTMVTVVEEIDIVIGKTTVNMKDGLIKLNGGNNDGLVLLNPLLSALNAIQKDINNLKTVFASGWQVTPQDGGAALKAAAGAWAGQRLSVTSKNDIENTKITQ